MPQVRVTLPELLKDWVDAQVQTGCYTDVSDYLRDLIRRDQEAGMELIEALEEGAASGVSQLTLDDIWQAAKQQTGNG